LARGLQCPGGCGERERAQRNNGGQENASVIGRAQFLQMLHEN
jgi:hypothetical protein